MYVVTEKVHNWERHKNHPVGLKKREHISSCLVRSDRTEAEPGGVSPQAAHLVAEDEKEFADVEGTQRVLQVGHPWRYPPPDGFSLHPP